MKFSATIITFNEEANIERCLKSLLPVADEIIVVDSFSSDRTVEIAEACGAKVIRRNFKGFTDQKNFAVESASYDHIISLDADEVLSEELQQEVLKAKDNWKYDGYAMNRLTNYCGQWIKHCGWHPEWKLRLFDRRKGSWKGDLIHESLEIKGKTAKLNGVLLHYSYPTISSHITQTEKFTNIASLEAYRKGKKVNPVFHIIFYPYLFFIKKYFIQNGYRDGYYGFVICAISAFGKMLKYIKLNEYYRKEKVKIRDEGITS